MTYATLVIASLWLATSASAAFAGSRHDTAESRPAAARSHTDGKAPQRHAFGLGSGKAWHENAGKWACIARSTAGTHGTTTVWSAYTSSRPAAERSALTKCDVAAVNKQDCRVAQCWIEGGR